MSNEIAEKLGRAFEEFKQSHTQQLEELKSGKADAVLAEKVERINDAITEFSTKMDEAAKEAKKADILAERLDEVEALARAPRAGSKDSGVTPEQAEHKAAFMEYLRSKHPRSGVDSAEAMARLRKAEKAVTIGTAADGGHGVPAPIAEEVFQKVLDISPIIGRVRRTAVSSPLYERLVDSRGLASGWAGEATTRSETGTPTINQVTFNHGELYAVPKASNWSLNDVQFDVERWLIDSVAEEFDYQLGLAITSGNGTNKPTGILNGTPSASDDEASPARAFQTIQYVFTGAAGGFQGDRLASPAGTPLDVFFDAIAAMKPRYLPNAAWYMNRTTAAEVRKFKDADGNYQWQPSLIVGEPDSFLGYGVVNNEHLADSGTDTFPVLFADLNAGYELITIEGMRFIRDQVTEKGHTLFYIAQRFGGEIVNDDAIKAIKCATS